MENKQAIKLEQYVGMMEEVRTTVGSIKENRDRYEEGFIRATSQQGDRLYCIVQRISPINDDGTVSEDEYAGSYFGNEDGAPLDHFTLAEALIESDIDLSGTLYEPDDWMGRKVLVWMIRGRPERVMIQSSLSKPRAIHPDHIKMARRAARSRRLKDPDAHAVLKTLGYSEEQIIAVENEDLIKVDPIGSHITYGNTAVWGLKVPAQDTINLADSLAAGIVMNVSKGVLGNRLCFKPAKAFTAR